MNKTNTNTNTNNENERRKFLLWIRKQWKQRSKVNIYSHSAKTWAQGTIKCVKTDKEGEWLVVKYILNHKTRLKEIQRYNRNIEPWSAAIDLCLYQYIYEAIQPLHSHTHTHSNGNTLSPSPLPRQSLLLFETASNTPSTNLTTKHSSKPRRKSFFETENLFIFEKEQRLLKCGVSEIGQCLHAQRLKYILFTNDSYSEQINECMQTLTEIFVSYDYTNTHLLNDFNHCKYHKHSGSDTDLQFYEIYAFLTNDNSEECDVNKCKHIELHYRDRTVKQSFANKYEWKDDSVYMIELISRVHVYFIHAYQIDRLTLNEIEQCNQEIYALESMDAKEIDSDLLQDRKMAIIADVITQKRRDSKFVNRFREESKVSEECVSVSVIDFDKVYAILCENIDAFVVDSAHLREVLSEYRDRNQFIADLIDCYLSANDTHLSMDNRVSQWQGLNKRERTQIYVTILYKYIALKELNHAHFMKLCPVIMADLGIEMDGKHFKLIARDANVNGQMFVQGSAEYKSSVKFAKVFENVIGYNKKRLMKVYTTLKKWNANILKHLPPPLNAEQTMSIEFKPNIVEYSVILDLLLTNSITNVTVVQLQSVFEYFDKDRFMSDIIDAYYCNNDEQLRNNYINTQSLSHLNPQTRNDIYACILFGYFKNAQLSMPNLAKMAYEIITDTAIYGNEKSKLKSSLTVLENENINLVKLSQFMETKKMNGTIFVKKSENSLNISKFSTMFATEFGKKNKKIFMNVYKCINKWKRTRNADSLAQIGMSNMESNNKSMEAKPNIITEFLDSDSSESMGSSVNSSNDSTKENAIYARGIKYYYWKCYKAHKHYITPKYGNLKSEILNHKKIKFDMQRWNALANECDKDMETDAVKEIRANGESQFVYGIGKDALFTFEHLCALKLYMDYTTESAIWCNILRKQNVQKIGAIAIRTRLLAECAQCYGSLLDDTKYYRGVTTVLEFEQFATRFNLPTSTTRDFNQASKFSDDGGGLVIELRKYKDRYDVYAFDCFKLSKYPEEQETLFFGGDTVLRISSIFRSVNDKWQTYKKYMEPLNVILRWIHGLSVREETRMLRSHKAQKTMFQLINYVFYEFNSHKTMLRLPDYIDQVLKHHMCNAVIKLNFVELMHEYPWMKEVFIKTNKYSEKPLVNIAKICKLFCNSDKIRFLMPAEYILSYTECISLITEDLLEIAVNDISVSIAFEWPLDMPRTNRKRIDAYQQELDRILFCRKYAPNSVTFECIEESPMLSPYAQRSIEDLIAKSNEIVELPVFEMKEQNIFELRKEVGFNCVLTVEGYLNRVCQRLLGEVENVILMFYAKPIRMYIRYKAQLDTVLYCVISDTWASITSKMMIKFKVNAGTHAVSLLKCRAKGSRISRVIDSYKFANERWNENDIFEIIIEENIIFGASWTPNQSQNPSFDDVLDFDSEKTVAILNNNSLSLPNISASVASPPVFIEITDIPITKLTESGTQSGSFIRSPPPGMTWNPISTRSISNSLTFHAQYTVGDSPHSPLVRTKLSKPKKSVSFAMDVQVHEYEYGSTLETTPSVLSMEHSEDTFVMVDDGYENEQKIMDFKSESGMPYNYSACASTGVYGTHMFYDHQRLDYLNKNTDRIAEYRKLDICERLNDSMPDKISIDHMVHKLYIENIQRFDRDEYLNDIIITNDAKHEYYAFELDSAIESIVESDESIRAGMEDWQSVLYDVCLYHFTECRLHDLPIINPTDIAFKNEALKQEWIHYLYLRGCDSFESMTDLQNVRPKKKKIFGDRVLRNDLIELPPVHTIRDSILGYHHYTIAVSHILKVYKLFAFYNLSVAFIMKKRYLMYKHKFSRDIPEMLREADITYSWHKMNGFLLNETIKIIFRTLGEYRQILANAGTHNKIVILFKFDHDSEEGEVTNNSNACSMYIYALQNEHSTLLPHIDDNHWSLFVLEFQYFNTQKVKCYWKIDGKSLRFFPEHMESVWPKYFIMRPKDEQRLIFNHKYRHQFGIALFDQSFCTLYYALTQKRFLSTHYYRQYHCKPKLSLKGLNLGFVNSSTESEQSQFRKIISNDCHTYAVNEHKCNCIKRLVFMLRKHSEANANGIHELIVIFQKCMYDLQNIGDDIDHLIGKHYQIFEGIYKAIYSYMVKEQNMSECKVKLACMALRRRTRSIEESKAESEHKEQSDIRVKTIQRILDHLHCDVFHRNPYQSFRQMFVNRSRTALLRTHTLAQFEQLILVECGVPKLPKLYEQLRSHGLSETVLNTFKSDMIDKGYFPKGRDRIRIIEDLNNNNSDSNIYDCIKDQFYKEIIDRVLVNNHYLRIAHVFRKYRIREEIFVNADKKDIQDLIEKESLILSNQEFDAIYHKILGEKNRKNLRKISTDSKEQKCAEFPLYSADNSDEWLSCAQTPKFQNMADELLLNTFKPLSRSDYIDTELECQSLHEKDKNSDIMSLQELIALKVFTDYSALQTEFSMAYYKSNELQRKREFYHWNLVLKQAMHYAAGPCQDGTKLFRGLKGLFHFESVTCIAQQPTSFSLRKKKAQFFCGEHSENGILLESTDAIGIPLRWLSNFEHEDEWWCFNTTFKLERIHIKCGDVGQRCKYLRYALTNMAIAIPKGDINYFGFEINDDTKESETKTDIRQYVIDLLNFENGKILQRTNYNELTVLQRLFFELKQYYLLELIWDFTNCDIEESNALQRIYLFQTFIFPNLDSTEHKEYIMDFVMNSRRICVDSHFCQTQMIAFITFLSIVSQSIAEYNAEKKNKRRKISDLQRESVIRYFRGNLWDCDTFSNTDESDLKLLIFLKYFNSRPTAAKLYQIIKNNIANNMKSAVAIDLSTFEQLQTEMVKFKQLSQCSKAQLVFLLKRVIFPLLDTQSHAITHQRTIFEMDLHSLMSESNKDTFNETVTNYVKQHSSNQDLSQTHNSETTANQTELFAQILSVSIDAHQLQYFAKSQKKLYKLEKAQILRYFREESNAMDLDTFSAMAKTQFTKQILFKKLKIKTGSGNKLYAIMRATMDEGIPNQSNILLTFTDLYSAINEWKSDKANLKPQTIIEYKLQKCNFDAFYALIGKFGVRFSKETTDFVLKLHPKQSDLRSFLERINLGKFGAKLMSDKCGVQSTADLMYLDSDELGKVCAECEMNEFQTKKMMKEASALHSESQKLLAQYPPKFNLLFSKSNSAEWEVSESTTTSFRCNDIISKMVEKPMPLQYRIALKYDKYELVSKVQNIAITEEVIKACKSVSDILASTDRT